MNLVVDTNIVFSAVINDKGKIGELLLNKPAELNFYSLLFLLEVLRLHANKIIAITSYSNDEYELIKSFVIKNISFVDQSTISTYNWDTAIQLSIDIDIKYSPFLALNLEIGGIYGQETKTD